MSRPNRVASVSLAFCRLRLALPFWINPFQGKVVDYNWTTVKTRVLFVCIHNSARSYRSHIYMNRRFQIASLISLNMCFAPSP